MTIDFTQLPTIFNAIVIILTALGVTSIPIMVFLKSRGSRAVRDIEDIAVNILQILNNKQLTIEEVHAIVADATDLKSALSDIYDAINAKPHNSTVTTTVNPPSSGKSS